MTLTYEKSHSKPLSTGERINLFFTILRGVVRERRQKEAEARPKHWQDALAFNITMFFTTVLLMAVYGVFGWVVLHFILEYR
jgi:heme/copper-type cytochrome/quinol oxidase subunit 2